MDKHNEGMLATWTGTAMTLLTAMAGFGVLLYPERRVLWVLVALFAVGAVLSFVQVVRIHRRAKRAEAPSPTYTSDGLDTGIPRTSPTSASGNVTTILQVLPSGTELPQPLTLRVECSRDLDDGWATFNTDTRVLNTTKRLPPIRADIKEGKIAFFELLAPKLSPPAMLSLNLMWHQEHDDEEDITVLVTRRE